MRAGRRVFGKCGYTGPCGSLDEVRKRVSEIPRQRACPRPSDMRRAAPRPHPRRPAPGRPHGLPRRLRNTWSVRRTSGPWSDSSPTTVPPLEPITGCDHRGGRCRGLRLETLDHREGVNRSLLHWGRSVRDDDVGVTRPRPRPRHLVSACPTVRAIDSGDLGLQPDLAGAGVEMSPNSAGWCHSGPGS